ncbi:MAG: hypothetical protein KGZ71_13620 [Desulfobulbaceae bacterium]|nr:hypothetical protein [Candidatus Kapabacteria bacterium]MBS4001511.1 hypothetical protein [Desulfobulbaceae bacterium]
MKKIITLVVCIICANVAVHAQFIDDALRYAKSNPIVSPRAAALNVAFYGISDDASAMLFNAAGLTLIGKSELNVGLGFTRNSSETDYLNFNNMLKTNVESITNAALISSFQFGSNKRNGAIGIGYFLEDDFVNTFRLTGVNNNYSMIASEVDFGPGNADDNWAYQLYLADELQNGNQFYFATPYRDSLSQSAMVTEKGGLHNVTAAFAYDVNEFVALAFSIAGKWGNYGYTREFTERDSRGIYANTNVGGFVFDNLQTHETLNQKVSGITGSVNIMARLEEFLRFGATIKFPTWYQFEEEFTAKYTANYRNEQSRFYEFDGESSYNLRTPFVYAAGLSVNTLGLTFSAGVEYTDVTQMEFSDALPKVMALNNNIILDLVGQTTWGLGAEYQIPIFPGMVRASYAKTTSPYQQDIPNAGVENFAIGGSVFVGKNIRIDGVMRWVDYSELRTTYTSPQEMQQYARYTLTKSPLNIMFGMAYRF